VNKLYNMVNRNLNKGYEFCCITDKCKEKSKFHPAIKLIPITDEFSEFGNNYKRLTLFSPIMQTVFREYILQIDIDMVILKPFDHLLSETNFKIWKCPSPRKRGYMLNTSFMLFKNGYLEDVYRQFKINPEWNINE